MGTYISNVKATRLTASGSIFGGPCRIVGIYYVADTTAGSITINDGGSSGTAIAVFDTPKGAAANAGENVVGYIPVPGDGLYCATNAYGTLSGVEKVTVFYG